MSKGKPKTPKSLPARIFGGSLKEDRHLTLKTRIHKVRKKVFGGSKKANQAEEKVTKPVVTNKTFKDMITGWLIPTDKPREVFNVNTGETERSLKAAEDTIDYSTESVVDTLRDNIKDLSQQDKNIALIGFLNEASLQALDKLVPVLLKGDGANINYRDKGNKTPLQVFVERWGVQAEDHHMSARVQDKYINFAVDLVKQGAIMNESILKTAKDKIGKAPYKKLESELRKVKFKLERKIMKNRFKLLVGMKSSLTKNDLGTMQSCANSIGTAIRKSRNL